MKPVHICLLAIAGLLVGAIAARRTVAQVGVPTARVAVCDVVHVFNESDRGKDIGTRFKVELEAIAQQVKDLDVKIEEKQEFLQSGGLNRLGSEYEKATYAHQELLLQRDAFLKLQQAKVGRKKHKLTLDMYREVLKTVSAVAKKQGIQIVLFRGLAEVNSNSMDELSRKMAARKVLYWDAKVDLTEVVLTALNTAYSESAE